MTVLSATRVQLIDAALAEQASKWRQDLHQIPELQFDLHKTQKYLISLLDKWQLTYDLGYGSTGIVVTIDGQNAGKTIAFRCDMDALGMPDESGKPWASLHEGVSHSCGHDGHMAVTLAMIKHLKDNNNFNGTVKVLFQPNEETGQGAKAMMDDGLFAMHPYSELYGFHNMPRLDDGTVQMRYGATTGAGECFSITITGVSGHSSVPHKCVNPISVTGEVVNRWHSLVEEHIDPNEMAVIATCKLNSGSTFNGIPEIAVAGGTMRYFEAHVADQMREHMHRIAKEVCDQYGANYDLNYEVLCPATVNTTEHVDAVARCAAEIYGEENINTNVPASPGGEDMQFFVPQGSDMGVCWYMVGTKGTNLHTSEFDFDDTSIRNSASLMANIVYARLA